MNSKRIVVVGGGAAGCFAAITAAERGASVTVLEQSSRLLDKVRISGGGRCNVTNACADPREFAARYPRGGSALLGPFQRFSARHTVDWFQARGVTLKTEADGRMFPVSDSSQTIIDCLLQAAQQAGVNFRLNAGVRQLSKLADGDFELVLGDLRPDSAGAERTAKASRASAQERRLSPSLSGIGDEGEGGRRPGEEAPRQPRVPASSSASADTAAARLRCDRVLLATGGCRGAAAGQMAISLGHTLEPPVPSLFTFQIASPWLRSLAGVATEAVVRVPSAKLCERGALLVTHWGVSGPAVLRLSAWGARALHALDYQFPLQINWLPDTPMERIAEQLLARRQSVGAQQVVNTGWPPLPGRLWESLVLAASVPRETRWSALTRPQALAMARQLTQSEFQVTGKSLNKDEFVTCGGVKLREVDFKTMQSKLCPGLYYAGEVLDIDGITGGFNFQAAWTTGFLAGCAMAA